MTDAPKNDHIQPALSGTATPMDSPQVAVRSLLHETPLDRPPTAPTSPTIPNRHRRKRSSSQKRSPATPAGPALDRQSQAEKQTLQQTVSDLQSLLLQYLRLLPWFPRDHPIVGVPDVPSAQADNSGSGCLQRVKLKRFLAPQTRIVLRWMGGILHRQNVRVPDRINVTTHILRQVLASNLGKQRENHASLESSQTSYDYSLRRSGPLLEMGSQPLLPRNPSPWGVQNPKRHGFDFCSCSSPQSSMFLCSYTLQTS